MKTPFILVFSTVVLFLSLPCPFFLTYSKSMWTVKGKTDSLVNQQLFSLVHVSLSICGGGGVGSRTPLIPKSINVQVPFIKWHSMYSCL